MWVLEAKEEDGSGNAIARFLLQSDTYTVGRKNTDIVISGAKSVSREHARVVVGDLGQCVGDARVKPAVHVEDTSKFGTWVDGKQITTKTACGVGDGTEIIFGASANTTSHFRLRWAPLVCTAVGVDTDLAPHASRVGAHLCDWSARTTHIVTPHLAPSLIIAQALLKGVEFVTPKWLQVLASEKIRSEWPTLGAYAPPLAPSLRASSLATLVHQDRTTLLLGMRVIFLSPTEQATHGPIVQGCGGKVDFWATGDVTEARVAQCEGKGYVLVEPSAPSAAASQVSALFKAHSLPCVCVDELVLAVCAADASCLAPPASPIPKRSRPVGGGKAEQRPDENDGDDGDDDDDDGTEGVDDEEMDGVDLDTTRPLSPTAQEKAAELEFDELGFALAKKRPVVPQAPQAELVVPLPLMQDVGESSGSRKRFRKRAVRKAAAKVPMIVAPPSPSHAPAPSTVGWDANQDDARSEHGSERGSVAGSVQSSRRSRRPDVQGAQLMATLGRGRGRKRAREGSERDQENEDQAGGEPEQAAMQAAQSSPPRRRAATRKRSTQASEGDGAEPPAPAPAATGGGGGDSGGAVDVIDVDAEAPARDERQDERSSAAGSHVKARARRARDEGDALVASLQGKRARSTRKK